MYSYLYIIRKQRQCYVYIAQYLALKHIVAVAIYYTKWDDKYTKWDDKKLHKLGIIKEPSTQAVGIVKPHISKTHNQRRKEFGWHVATHLWTAGFESGLQRAW